MIVIKVNFEMHFLDLTFSYGKQKNLIILINVLKEIVHKFKKKHPLQLKRKKSKDQNVVF